MGTGLGLTWIFWRDRVPITERKRFNCLSDEWMLKNAHKYNTGAIIVHFLVNASRIQPSLLLPDDHPTSAAVKGIFNRLVNTAAAELAVDTEDWKIDIIATSDHNIVIATEDGHFMVCTKALGIWEDENTLAALISSELAYTAVKLRAAGLSNHFFKLGAALPAAQLVITSLFLPAAWVLAIPYMCLYGNNLMISFNKLWTKIILFFKTVAQKADIELRLVKKLRQWIPEIRDKFGDMVVDKQEHKLLPTEPYLPSETVVIASQTDS
ncbi:hypothetical protein N431DRAFT_472090 [Stipitochalara longipes BDJ]|nr:hypothetical protein N431DRAFT_472090 [Stipitochalara longipes BDJ]